MTAIHAYLIFNGNCREAMQFYHECFGGGLSLQTVKDSPMADQWPGHVQENILHASLVKENLVLLGSDMAAPDGIVRGNSILIALSCSSEEEIREFFARLSDGGHVTHPLHTFFNGIIGSLTDKFGVSWVLKL